MVRSPGLGRGRREIDRHLRCAAAALALAAALSPPASAQPAARPKADRPAPATAAAEGPAAIACPSLANYRALMGGGPAAAAATLADPKADHLGCAPLARGRITGVADRVSLGGRAYACVGVPHTSACHWMDAAAAPEGR